MRRSILITSASSLDFRVSRCLHRHAAHCSHRRNLKSCCDCVLQKKTMVNRSQKTGDNFMIFSGCLLSRERVSKRHSGCVGRMSILSDVVFLSELMKSSPQQR